MIYNLDVDDQLWREVKMKAARVGKPIKEVINKLLEKWVKENSIKR